LYEYSITKSPQKIDFVEVSTSVTQAVIATDPASILIQPAFGGSSDFLEGALHEYTVKFDVANPYEIPSLKIYVKPGAAESSRARVGTVQVKGGTTRTRCLIATPGTRVGDEFQPAFTEQKVIVAGGKCLATLLLDGAGNVADIPVATPISPFLGPCELGSPTSGEIIIKGPDDVPQPLKNNSGPHGITFGTGTTTCYGPPRPSIPKCVCTATPCP
jgi:hypothetical protein